MFFCSSELLPPNPSRGAPAPHQGVPSLLLTLLSMNKTKSSGFQFQGSEDQERFMDTELREEIFLCIIRWPIHNKTPPNCIQIELEKTQLLWVTFATREKRSQTWCVPFHTLFWDFKILFLSVERFFLKCCFCLTLTILTQPDMGWSVTWGNAKHFGR